jgi:glycosyltransferase involved in cell wall biosynthesis
LWKKNQTEIDLLKSGNEEQYKKLQGHFAEFKLKVKGIDDLLKAWNISSNKDWKLDVVGPKDNNFFYKKIVKLSQNNSYNNVSFLKPIFRDQQKFKLFNRYDLLILPSKSESFGMVVLESLSRGLPVLTTANTPWHSIKKYNAGWIISNNYSGLVNTLKKIFCLSVKKFNIKSNNAINLSKNYKLDLIIKKYLKVYRYLLAIKK